MHWNHHQQQQQQQQHHHHYDYYYYYWFISQYAARICCMPEDWHLSCEIREEECMFWPAAGNWQNAAMQHNYFAY